MEQNCWEDCTSHPWRNSSINICFPLGWGQKVKFSSNFFFLILWRTIWKSVNSLIEFIYKHSWDIKFSSCSYMAHIIQWPRTYLVCKMPNYLWSEAKLFVPFSIQFEGPDPVSLLCQRSSAQVWRLSKPTVARPVARWYNHSIPPVLCKYYLFLQWNSWGKNGSKLHLIRKLLQYFPFL